MLASRERERGREVHVVAIENVIEMHQKSAVIENGRGRGREEEIERDVGVASGIRDLQPTSGTKVLVA